MPAVIEIDKLPDGVTFADLTRAVRLSRFERAALLVNDDPSMSMQRALVRVDRFDDEGC